MTDVMDNESEYNNICNRIANCEFIVIQIKIIVIEQCGILDSNGGLGLQQLIRYSLEKIHDEQTKTCVSGANEERPINNCDAT